jgi:type II secretory pathway predicted ATPase ExeA
MYERYFGLRERPFELSPNPRFLFLSNKHREALTHLQYGLAGRPGVTVLIGEAGTGKSMLVRTALHALGGVDRGIVHLSNPTLTRTEFFEFLAAGFGFTADAAASKTTFLRELEAAIALRAESHTTLSLIVDEAQSLPHELLEEIRLLTNIEVAGRSLAVVLVGQPELSARLNDSSLRQLKQRVALRCELAPLDFRETASYIAGRIGVAGGNAELMFTRDAVIAIHEHSKGIPRTISVICDNALVSGFAGDQKPVGKDVVLEVCRDFQFGNQVVLSQATIEQPIVKAVAPSAEPAPAKPAPTAPKTPTTTKTAETRESGAQTKDAANAERDLPGNRDQLFSRFNRPRRFSFF